MVTRALRSRNRGQLRRKRVTRQRPAQRHRGLPYRRGPPSAVKGVLSAHRARDGRQHRVPAAAGAGVAGRGKECDVAHNDPCLLLLGPGPFVVYACMHGPSCVQVRGSHTPSTKSNMGLHARARRAHCCACPTPPPHPFPGATSCAPPGLPSLPRVHLLQDRMRRSGDGQSRVDMVASVLQKCPGMAGASNDLVLRISLSTHYLEVPAGGVGRSSTASACCQQRGGGRAHALCCFRACLDVTRGVQARADGARAAVPSAPWMERAKAAYTLCPERPRRY